jgi:hypothetical protein
MGNTLDDAIDITKRLTLAAMAIGVPFDLVRLQIDDIMRGVVTTRTTLARVLGITQDQLKIHRQQGTIIEYVRQKTQAFLEAQEMLAGTYQIIINRVKLLLQMIAMQTTAGIFEKIRDVLGEILKQIVVVDKLTGEMKFSPAFAANLDAAKVALEGFVETLLAALPSFVWFGQIIADLATGFLVMKLAAQKVVLQSTATWLQGKVGIDPNLIKAFEKEADAYGDLIDRVLRANERVQAGAEKFGSVLEGLERKWSERRAGKPGMALNMAQEIKNATDEIARQLQVLQKQGKKPGEIQANKELLQRQLLGAILGTTDPKEISRAVAEAYQVIGSDAAEARAKLVKLTEAEAVLGYKTLSPEEKFERIKPLLEVAGIYLDPKDLGGATKKSLATTLAIIRAAKDELKKRAEQIKVEAKPYTAEEAEKETRRRAAEAVAHIRYAGEEQLLDIARRRLTVEQQLADLERPRAGLSQVERLERRAELEKQLADLVQEREVTQASTEREAAKAEARGAQAIADRGRALKDEAQGLQAHGEALKRQADLEERIAEARRKEAVDALRARGELQGFRAAGREVQAEYELVAARRELALIEATATDMNKADVARAEAKVRLLEAQLNLIRAQNKLLEAAAKVELALFEYRQATTLGPEATREKAVALAQAEQASAEARVGVAQAQQGLEQTSLENNRAIADALREQATWADSVLGVMSTLSEIVSRFSAGLPKSLSQFFASFEALTKLSKNFKKNVQDALTSLGKTGEATKAATPLGALKETFKSWENLAAAAKQGGLGQLGGMFATVAANFKQSMTQGLGAALLSMAKFMGPGGPIAIALGSLLSAFSQQTAFSWKGAVVGALAGMGAALAGFKIGFLAGGPVGGAMGALIGGLSGGMFKGKATRRVARQVAKGVAAVVNSFNSGTSAIKQTLAALEVERQKAIAKLSGRKGGGAELDLILAEIDKTKAELLAKQKEIFTAFEKEMAILRLPEYYQDIGKAIQSMTENVKAYLDAGGDAARAQEYLLRRQVELSRDLNRELRDDELEAIDMLQRRIDLEKQRADVIADAAKQEREVRAGLGLARPLTPAQQAALRIKEIREQRDERIAAIDKELRLLDAQLEGRAALFGLTQDLNALEERRLDLTRSIGEETNAQIKALQDFLTANRELFELGLALPLQNMPNLPIISGGQVVTNFTGDIIVTVNPSPGMTPREAWEAVHDGIEWGMGHRHEI